MNETTQGYCFETIQNRKKASFFQQLYENQFENPNNCSTTFVKSMWSYGFGSSMDNLVDGLRYAKAHNVPFVIYTEPRGWNYAAPRVAGTMTAPIEPAPPACPTKDLYCFFLASTACSSPMGPDEAIEDQFVIGTNRELWDQPNRPEVYWYLQFLLRPQTWLRRRIFEFVKLQKQHFAKQVEEQEAKLQQSETQATSLPLQARERPCTVFHVRRADVSFEHDDGRRYHSIAEYMNAGANGDFPIHRNILLLTDDANAIEEATRGYPQYSWMYIHRKRFRGDEGGYENPLPSNDPIQEMVTLLGTFQLIAQCQSYIYTRSNLASLFAGEVRSLNANTPILELGRRERE